MTKVKKETRGRKPLYKGPTVTAGVVLSETLFNKLVKEGEKSGKGYSHHIRLAVEKMYGKKTRRKN